MTIRVVKRKAEIGAHLAAMVKSLMPEVDGRALTWETPLAEGGVDMDSVKLLQLVVSAERTFGVEIEDDELSRDVVATLGSLADFFWRKLQVSPER